MLRLESQDAAQEGHVTTTPAPSHWTYGKRAITINLHLPPDSIQAQSLADQAVGRLIGGGSQDGQWVFINDPQSLNVAEGQLSAKDVILEVNDQPVSGFARRDVVAWITHCLIGRQGVAQLICSPPLGRIIRFFIFFVLWWSLVFF